MQRKEITRREKGPHLRLLGYWPAAIAQDSAEGIQAVLRHSADF